MGESDAPALWPSRLVRGLIWLIYFVAWSTALLLPVPVKPGEGLRDPDLLFLFSKSLHVLAYAFFAGLTGWLRPAGRQRWLLIGLLAAHGAATEFLQWYFPELGRYGCVRDVLLDWLGIALGVAVTWNWWRQPAG